MCLVEAHLNIILPLKLKQDVWKLSLTLPAGNPTSLQNILLHTALLIDMPMRIHGESTIKEAWSISTINRGERANLHVFEATCGLLCVTFRLLTHCGTCWLTRVSQVLAIANSSIFWNFFDI